ncbi:hypothetical protein [Sphingomicrobium astaxanthinifaciens]|uniref:hypothetical protein n=1 Tax=Sphingomicrobium astaxanthinifaciens TaxID=1227949 RepID=UPI001FCB64C0|nr:hypothetical protein [Sphingomicrobium astaxanthinifaciens]MCJ7422006.1 hypothetical protein [Sphingomicrobium astaxanthinifaciens]
MTRRLSIYSGVGAAVLLLALIGAAWHLCGLEGAPDRLSIAYLTLVGVAILAYDRFRFID